MADSDDKSRKDFISPEKAAYNRTEGGAMIRHIDSELQGLKDLALQMGSSVEKALENACSSILAKDKDQCYLEVSRHESRINDLQILIDESCVNV